MALALLAGACTQLADGLRSHAPPDGTESARRLEPGPFPVERKDFRLVDDSRPTMPNGDFPGAPERVLEVSVRLPEGAEDPRPLLVYAHGYTGNRDEMAYLLDHLASHGYVVAAFDFPLTNGDAPGGPTPRDLARQPGDVRFVIDALLDPDRAEPEVAARIDPQRIALAGLSYGGLTTTLAAFHPTERDPRLAAAISIAGPSQMFDERFFARGGPPFLMLAGTADGLVPFEQNAEPIPQEDPGAGLVALEAGTHLGFVEFATRWMRFSHNPDATACETILERSGADDVEDPFAPEAGPDPFAPLEAPGQGVDFDAWQLPCTGAAGDPPRAMRPQRQHHLSVLAVRAFLDSRFARDPGERAEADGYLSERLSRELPDVHFTRLRVSTVR